MSIMDIIQTAIILLVSIGMHEYAHAYTSYKLGDITPKMQNRLTPNPFRHVDPIGFLSVFLIGFGRGKPVQINPLNYKKPIQGELLVALAGPATNIVLSIIGILIILIYSKLGGLSLNDIFYNNSLVNNFWIQFSMINIILAIFNMIPIPPLDGFSIIKILWFDLAQKISQYTLYISIAFLFFILGPGKSIIGGFLSGVSNTIFNILFIFFSNIFY